MPSYVLGVHDGHNGSAAILKDGNIVFAIQEERIRGQKNYSGWPEKAIEACLAAAGISPEQVDHVAIAALRRTPQHMRTTNMQYAAKREATRWGYFRRWFMWYPVFYLCPNIGASERLEQCARLGLRKGRVQRYDHHLGHAGHAYFGMREKPDERYLVITIDGFGDRYSATISIGEKGKLQRIATSHMNNSLGMVYATVTGQMGFTMQEHEYKLMGMAPYASPKYAEDAAEKFRALIDVDEDGMKLVRKTIEPSIVYARRIREIIMSERFDNVCAGLQLVTEEVVVKLVKAAIKKTGIRKVLCSGGVFMNVKANKRIMELPEVDYLGVAPSPGDESLSIGIAWYAHAQRGGKSAADEIHPLEGLYLGTDVDDAEAERVVKESGHQFTRYDDIETEIAKLLAAGEPVARCKGRMEFGARALCNRSILADPKNLDIVRVINRMVKKRDFWMPFAPVVRRDRVPEYFTNPKNFRSPYMMLTFDTYDHNFRDLIAAVQNADLTARAQVLEEHHNPDVWRLMKKFEELTGRGVLLNTSFNLHGYPIVHGPQEAMFVFNNSGLTYLAVGPYLVHKSE